ncbi:uncharacterized protein L201_007053 [Kwoniella dendrophila CBS 6074]|uniref:BZIP domain-containing protein n=1 Tax=Kwoniella dendrophila CBS 6074 TaxID=1295534 RepID=A0AAX4K3Z0_9TREE
MSPTSSISSKSLLSNFKGNSTTSLMNLGDDMDGRTRNAKAQKRHREKQKARVKALEESVQVLTAQLEDARRQLGQLPYPPGPSRMPLGNSPEFAQLQSENGYLRDENADLRRQLYTLRVTYGQENPNGNQMPSPPPRHGSGQGRSNTNPSGSSNPGNNDSNNNNDPYRNSSGNGNRSRVLSASSAPSASPYVGSSSFPADLRAHSLSNSNNNNNNSSNNSNNGGSANRPQQIESNYPVRYEGHMYPPTAPPPHALPRSQMYNVEGMPYGGRGGGEGGENMPWGSESGPPPFAGSMGYQPVNFHENNSSNNVSEPWRQDH